MGLNAILNEQGLTKYKLAKLSNIPHATLNDICTGKSRIEKCSSETLYKLAKALNISMELLFEKILQEQNELRHNAMKERSYEYGLPEYLQNDLNAYKEALVNGSSFWDCLWGELYGSINAAEISDGAISAEHADYLRRKYLWR